MPVTYKIWHTDFFSRVIYLLFYCYFFSVIPENIMF